ncbi:MAG: zinc ribbon domain-containing protein [Coriobacteriaceae bacterium]|jgi:RNA polymerase subunit RPABC4/transcription elongation factor Spt4|nr:zinc ribbon domain-containing protein [Coriobacteriaceae bacterium]
MTELLSQLWTPELQQALTVVVTLLVVLYVLSIIWVVRDAYLRGSFWYIWAIVALIPLLGTIAYCLLRPPLLQIDRDEQELEIALKQRELMRYGECAACGYPVEADYVLCPNCHQQLKNLCLGCGKALDPTWTVCPYCTAQVSAALQQQPRRSAVRGRAPEAAQPAPKAHVRSRQTRSRVAALPEGEQQD